MSKDKIMSFRINGKLPSLNEVIAENRKGARAGAALKRAVQERIGWELKPFLLKKAVRPVTGPCRIHIFWHEDDLRRDVDNIQSAQKFILDALVDAGVLPDDGRRYVRQIYHEIHTGDEAYVVVAIEEV